MTEYLESNYLLYFHQSGFRESKSTIDAVLYFLNEVSKGLESGETSLATFLDLSKTFDCFDEGASLSLT